MQRHDPYGPIHKGLRLALSRLVMRIGATDFADPRAVSDLIAAVRRQMALSSSHLEHEEDFIHTALETRAPGAASQLAADHDHHRLEFRKIEALMRAVEDAPAKKRPQLGRMLYLAFSSFVAADFAHMAGEELVTLPLLHQLFSDEELIAIEGAIVASLPGDEMVAFMQLAVPAMNATERLGFMSFVRGGAPAHVFEALLTDAVRPALEEEDYRALELGLAA